MPKRKKKITKVVATSALSQVRNSATGNFILRNSRSGKIIDVKTSRKPFLGIRTVKSKIKSNPSVARSVAKKAEKAVIQLKRRKK
jgi:hypothetical protein